MHFEWDPVKARNNLRKHGLTFEEASSVFYDSLAVTGAGHDHSAGEERMVTFGVSSSGRLLLVAHTERSDAIRIISARVAPNTKGTFMKKAKAASHDELRTEYKRSDFEKLERGKYYDRVKESSKVVVLADEIAAVFPNSAAVTRALHTLVEVARKNPASNKAFQPTRKNRA